LAANVFSILFIVLILAGVAIDFFFFTKPEFRLKFQADRAPPTVNWHFSLLFKFFIWFFGLMIILTLVLSAVKRFIPQISDNFFVIFHTTCAEVLSFAVIYFLIKKNGGNLGSLGFRLPEKSWFKEMRIGWMGYLGVLPLFGLVLISLLAIADLLHYEPPPHPLVPIFLEEGGHSNFLVLYSMSLAIFFGPLFEEIFFRGFCYPVLKSKIGKTGAMLITSAFFALIHDNTFAFWPIFVLGLALNYIYEKRGSLLPSFVLHVTHNLLFLSYFFLAKDIISREIGG
jgi:membrane protease YdiL (CAAX protease family)